MVCTEPTGPDSVLGFTISFPASPAPLAPTGRHCMDSPFWQRRLREDLGWNDLDC